MKMGGNFEQSYNAQAVVDGNSQLIIANGLTNNAADNGELLPMVEAVKNNLGHLPKRSTERFWVSLGARLCRAGRKRCGGIGGIGARR